ncbi:MAG: DUF3108 domain-containing protein [Gemmatimonadetes bacterium]|nr:DUF3108 domain-containing protein [Gemmatimonadota bacterium]
MIHLAILFLCAMGALTPAVGQDSATSPPTAGTPFPPGERLKYEVRWGVVTLGTAEMRVVGIDTIRGTPAAHIQFRIVGSNYLYRMDNRMDSWIALSDTTSRRFTQDFQENRKERHAWYDIFPDSGYYREKGVDGPRPSVKNPLDDAAFFYFVRTMGLEPGRKYEINRYFRPDRNPVILDVLSRDTLDVPAGKFPSIVLQPIIKGQGILKETSDARMWLSDDDRHLMVQLKSRFPVVGYLTMRLIRIESGPKTSKSDKVRSEM